MSRPVVLAAALGLAVVAAAGEDIAGSWVDRFSYASADGRIRARVSGLLDLEYYEVPQPPAGLLFTDNRELFSPRATTYLDLQAGDQVYAFVQVRADRGFDPSGRSLRLRLDEYALRLQPVKGDSLVVQAGKFATVFGGWVQRHDSWANPFVGAPLPYENLTGVWDAAPVRSSGQLLAWAHLGRPSTPASEYADKHLRLPIIWGSAYATGVAVTRRFEAFDAALELKNAGISSRPVSWDARRSQWRHPAVAGRVGFRPNPAWSAGISAATGPYLRASARGLLPAGKAFGDYRQETYGADGRYEWHYWQVWAEVMRARFAIPLVGSARTSAWYVEVRRKLSPVLALALRWNQQDFGAVPGGSAGKWGRNCQRMDLGVTLRFSGSQQLKLQYGLLKEDQRSYGWRGAAAVQFTTRY